MESIKKYREFCYENKKVPIFANPWWLDAACGEGNWNVAILEKGSEIYAALPYLIVKEKFITKIRQPILTPRLGPIIVYPKGQKYEARLAFEKSIINELIVKIPNVDLININCHISNDNWLPFHWLGFSQTTRYTYWIPSSKAGSKEIQERYKGSTRTAIRKAKKIVKIEEANNIIELYDLVEMTFKRQGLPVPYSKDKLQNIVQQSFERNRGEILLAVDEENQYHAGAFFVWDDESLYYLIGGANPSLRNSGAQILLVDEGIGRAKEKEINFDFEGSMIEPIAKTFASFGAIQKPYNSLSKVNNRLLKLYYALK